jgi:hypothetical protein
VQQPSAVLERLRGDRALGHVPARVYSCDADGERFPLGTVSVGTPLRVEEVVIEPCNESSVFFINAGDGEIEDLRYEGRIEPV